MLGMHAARYTNQVIEECDLLIAIGARFDDRATGKPDRFAPRAQVIHIDIDPRDANHIIASACSGIYESKNAGDSWRKVQGIPSQSRRTRAILQHPSIPGIVFAGLSAAGTFGPR